MSKSRGDNSLSKKEEHWLLEAGKRVLLSEGFPNPERSGCPQPEVLKAIALRRMPLAQATQYVDHVASCSPCFVEYTAFQKQAARRKTLELMLASAALLIVTGVAGWLWKFHGLREIGRKPEIATVMPYQKVTVDLRNRIVFRGEQPASANSGPIQLPRGRLDLTILLPKDSGPGNYGVRVSTELEKTLVTTTGVAVNENRITTLNVKLDVSNLSPGGYVLAIGPAGGERREYPLVVK